MNKYKELLFLKELKGVGPVRINKVYVPMLRGGLSFDEVISFVKDNESKADEDNIISALSKAEDVYSKMTKKSDIQIVTVLDKNYPAKIRIMGNKAPVILYVKGNLSLVEEKTISVVGTREPSTWSEKVEKQLVGKIIELSDRVIVSGLAAGCDTIGHKSCIENGGATVAMLPCGFDHITPYENEELSKDIIEKGGALITEYLPEVEATTYTFVERDRLIAALGDATFVVECGIKSGTMHTVNAAIEYTRKIATLMTDKEKGHYEGNIHIVEEMGGCAISDSSSLKDFLQSISVADDVLPEQISLFDIYGD